MLPPAVLSCGVKWSHAAPLWLPAVLRAKAEAGQLCLCSLECSHGLDPARRRNIFGRWQSPRFV
jgi:hypothetical protein